MYTISTEANLFFLSLIFLRLYSHVEVKELSGVPLCVPENQC